MLLRGICLLLLILLPFSVFSAGAPQEITLKDAVLLALRYNPLVRNAELDRILNKFDLRLAENKYEVQYALTGSASYGNQVAGGISSTNNSYDLKSSTSILTPLGSTVTLSAANPVTYSYGQNAHYNPAVSLEVKQPLLRGFGREVTLTPLYDARDIEQIDRLAFKQAIMQTITRVISQYTQLVQAENTLTTQQLALDNSIALLNQTRAFIKAGRKAPADIVQFQSDVANQQLALKQQQVAVQQAQLGLLNTLGLDPNFVIVAPSKVGLGDKRVPSLAQSLQLALANNTDYQRQQLNFNVIKRRLVIARDQQKWELNLIATQTQGQGTGGSPNSSFGSLANGQNRNSAVKLELAIPIHDLERKQQLVQAKIDLEKAQIRLAADKRQLISDTIQAYNTLQNQKQQITQAQEAVRYAEDNLRLAKAKIQYGKATPFEISSIQTALTNAQIAYIQSEINYINTLAGFDEILGTTLSRWGIQLRY